MYGTVAKVKAKGAYADEIRNQLKNRKPKGMVDAYILQSDDNPEELWLVALFEDKQSYTKNAESPEQNEDYNQLTKFMNGQPEWHDGKVLFHLNK